VISGTPTADVTITLGAASAKTQEETPQATFSAEGNTLTISNVTAGMTYRIDDGEEQKITGTTLTLTGLDACTVTIRKPASDRSKTDSEVQTVTITKPEAPDPEYWLPSAPGSMGIIYTDATQEISTDGVNYTRCEGESRGLADGTYYVRTAANGTALASEPKVIVIEHRTEVTLTFETNGGSAVAAQTVMVGSRPQRPKNPTRAGLTFWGWYADAGLKQRFDFSESLWEDAIIYARWEDYTPFGPEDDKVALYPVTEGANGLWTAGASAPHMFRIVRSVQDELCYRLFKNVYLNGRKLVRDRDYTAEPGSTIIRLTPALLWSLEPGTYRVTVEFEDGSAETMLTVVNQFGTERPTPPKTGDMDGTALWLMLIALGLTGLTAAFAGNGKRRAKKQDK
nr:InlB B-repeat-containing protein [Clostridia bacterium]